MQRQGIPDGYVFRPSDMDLLAYLALFVTGKSVDSTVPIPERNLYIGIEPWEIFDKSKDKILYFFTPLDKKSPSTSRYRRVIGDGKGTWKSQDKGKPIYRSDNVDDSRRRGQLIGYKRSLRYENKNLPEHDGQFLMKEYYLPEKIRASLQGRLKDFVLCRIKRKRDGSEAALSESQSIEAEDIGDIIGELQSKYPNTQGDIVGELQSEYPNTQIVIGDTISGLQSKCPPRPGDAIGELQSKNPERQGDELEPTFDESDDNGLKLTLTLFTK